MRQLDSLKTSVRHEADGESDTEDTIPVHGKDVPLDSVSRGRPPIDTLFFWRTTWRREHNSRTMPAFAIADTVLVRRLL